MKNKILLFLSLIFICQTNYAQTLSTLKVDYDVSDKVPIETIKKVAQAEALKIWGHAIIGKVIPLVDINGKIEYYQVVVRIDGNTNFPTDDELFKELQNNGQKKIHGLRWDEKIFATIYVAARKDFLPVPKITYGLPKFYTAHKKLLDQSQKLLGANAQLNKIYFDGFQCGYEFSNNNSSVILDTYTFSKQKKEHFDIYRNLNTNDKESKKNISKVWNKVLEFKEQLISNGTIKINNWDRIYRFDWACGCSPTAAATALSYYDHKYQESLIIVDTLNRNIGNGRLIEDYLFNKRVESFKGADGKYFSTQAEYEDTPNLTVELAIAMKTKSSGGTWPPNIGPGICNVVNNNGYDCDSKLTYLGMFSWDKMKKEINDNHPFVVNIIAPAHSLCAYGYTNDKYILTFDSDNEISMLYYTKIQSFNRFSIETIQSDGDIELLQPVGREGTWGIFDTYKPGNVAEIKWYQWGTKIDHVQISYTTNEYQNQFFVITNQRSYEGRNTFKWQIPSLSYTEYFRIYISGYDKNNTLIAADGSSGYICIDPSISITPKNYDFGNVKPGNSYTLKLLLSKLYRRGFQDLKLEFQNPTNIFKVIEPTGLFDLSDPKDITIQFTPEAPNIKQSYNLSPLIIIMYYKVLPLKEIQILQN